MTFSDPVTENPAVGATEVWEFHNTTGDLHPIHMHLLNFRNPPATAGAACAG